MPCLTKIATQFLVSIPRDLLPLLNDDQAVVHGIKRESLMLNGKINIYIYTAILKAGSESYKDPTTDDAKKFLIAAKQIFKQVIPSQLLNRSN